MLPESFNINLYLYMEISTPKMSSDGGKLKRSSKWTHEKSN